MLSAQMVKVLFPAIGLLRIKFIKLMNRIWGLQVICRGSGGATQMAIQHRADPTRNTAVEFTDSTEISGERIGRALFQESGRRRVTFLYVKPTDVRRVTLTPDEYRFPFMGCRASERTRSRDSSRI